MVISVVATLFGVVLVSMPMIDYTILMPAVIVDEEYHDRNWEYCFYYPPDCLITIHLMVVITMGVVLIPVVIPMVPIVPSEETQLTLVVMVVEQS